MERWQTVSQVALYVWYMIAGTAGGLATWGYLLRYLYKSKGAWRRSLTGAALVTLGTSLALMFTFIGVNLWLTVLTGSANYPARVPIGTGLFSLLALAVVLIWIAFEKAQRE